jgi:hypothetical protein
MPLTRKFVLVALADMARDDGTSYASISHLEEYTCMTDRSVQRALADLETTGFVVREFRHGRSTLYRLTDPSSWSAQTPDSLSPPTESHPRTTVTAGGDTVSGEGDTVSGEGDTQSPISITKASPKPKSEAQTSLATLADDVDEARSIATEESPVPDSDLLGESARPAPKRAPKNGRKRAPVGTVEGWDEFWALYPRKDSKANARKAWNKLKPDDELRAKILAALATQAEGWRERGTERRFIPHPATWLNGARWDDEPAETINGAPLPASCGLLPRETNTEDELVADMLAVHANYYGRANNSDTDT